MCHVTHFTLRSARAHVHTPYLYLRNGLTDRAQICCVVGSLLVTRLSHCGLHVRTCTPISVAQERLGRLRSNLLCICDPISCDPISLRGGRLAGWRFARLAVCAVGGLRGWRFARLAVCAVGGLRGWRFAQLAVCAVGGLRSWRFARLAVCAVGGLRGWRFAQLAVCAVGCLRGWRFALCSLRLTIGSLRFALDVVLQLEFCDSS